jgi:hypothetical protein
MTFNKWTFWYFRIKNLSVKTYVSELQTILSVHIFAVVFDGALIAGLVIVS